MRIVDALLLTAGTPAPGDPLHPLTQGRRKAWLPIAGKPMVEWVLDALDGTREIRNLVISGATPGEVGPPGRKPRTFVPDHGDMLANLLAGGAQARATTPPPTHVLVVSSDIPAVTADVIDWHVAATRDSTAEAHVFLIAQDVMERRFPSSGRTFVRLREGRFVFDDMCLFSLALLRDHHPVWPRLIATRKSFGRQLRLIGLDSVVLWMLGRLSVARCAARMRSRLDIDAAVSLCPYAEAGMDVDKPVHYERLAADLALQSRSG